HARNVLVASAEAVVAIGGGAGTLSEMAFAWIYGRLRVALVGVGGWSEKLAGHSIDERGGFGGEKEARVLCASTPEEVLSLLKERV
ncbi:MAG: TIGR00725 family protein, partial [Sandaracinaceae bacterium]|nr:TIGR00725 family protein [Sandaracinaceae bacterium]